LSICKKINPIMSQLAEDPELVKYVRPLHQVILTRLLQQVCILRSHKLHRN
jgi:translation initiation factor 3 subunit A